MLVTALSGCGGSGSSSQPKVSDQQQITQILQSYLTAQTAGNGQTACPLLSAGAQNQLIGLVVSAAKGLLPSRPSCENAVALVSQFAGSTIVTGLKNAKVENVKVNGSNATAEIVDGGAFSPEQVKLQKVDGTWKITGVPSLGG
jgi:hypothetical protein